MCVKTIPRRITVDVYPAIALPEHARRHEAVLAFAMLHLAQRHRCHLRQPADAGFFSSVAEKLSPAVPAAAGIRDLYPAR